MSQLRVTGDLSLPLAELRFSFDRSPGPGGQNVNKLNTRVEVRFDVDSSPSLSPDLHRRLRHALRGRLTQDGQLIVRSSQHRSQAQNRRECLSRLAAILAHALRPPPPRRRPTRPTTASRTRRLEGKRRDSQKKAARQRPRI